jgi:hypothetical protein
LPACDRRPPHPKPQHARQRDDRLGR